MSNRWGIPKIVEEIVSKRDLVCVYCGVAFTDERRFKKSWEHIINDINIATVDNIALCCVGCNASKGTKSLRDWLESKNAKNRGISEQTLSDVVKKALRENP